MCDFCGAVHRTLALIYFVSALAFKDFPSIHFNLIHILKFQARTDSVVLKINKTELNNKQCSTTVIPCHGSSVYKIPTIKSGSDYRKFRIRNCKSV